MIDPELEPGTARPEVEARPEMTAQQALDTTGDLLGRSMLLERKEQLKAGDTESDFLERDRHEGDSLQHTVISERGAEKYGITLGINGNDIIVTRILQTEAGSRELVLKSNPPGEFLKGRLYTLDPDRNPKAQPLDLEPKHIQDVLEQVLGDLAQCVEQRELQSVGTLDEQVNDILGIAAPESPPAEAATAEAPEPSLV